MFLATRVIMVFINLKYALTINKFLKFNYSIRINNIFRKWIPFICSPTKKKLSSWIMGNRFFFQFKYMSSCCLDELNLGGFRKLILSNPLKYLNILIKSPRIRLTSSVVKHNSSSLLVYGNHRNGPIFVHLRCTFSNIKTCFLALGNQITLAYSSFGLIKVV